MVVSWTISTSPSTELVNTMLDKAIGTLGEGERPVIHSDRGCHYRWPGWIERMDGNGLCWSMSRKGCSPDNSAYFAKNKEAVMQWLNICVATFIICAPLILIFFIFQKKFIESFIASGIK